MDLNYIKGVNLGNWLVLEKWMNPALFDGTTADDEYYLPTQLDPAVYEARIRTHRAEYINERDSATIKSWGLNSVRIPVPYFIFGDRAPFIGCIDELDKAFNWAEKYGLTILIDLHTAPMSQNGFDNGGISGVCKWAQLPDEVEFVLSVLERLAKRYGHRRALMGIEIINEPNTTTCWPMANATRRSIRNSPKAPARSHSTGSRTSTSPPTTVCATLTRARCRPTKSWCSTTVSTSNSGRTSCAAPTASSRPSLRTWSSIPTNTS